MNQLIEKKRSGITITEALASIAVAAVGLFGVLAVIPFAARQAETGLDLDFAVSAGKNAFHEFEIRKISDRSLWRIGYVDDNMSYPPSLRDRADGNPLVLTPPNQSTDARTGQAWNNRVVVIDPLFLKSNQPLSTFPPGPPPANTVEPAIDHFPLGNFDSSDPDPDDFFGNKTSLTVRRINIASKTATDTDLFQATPTTNDDPIAYNFAQAKNVFGHHDDLSFDEPQDKLDLPPQKYKLVDPSGSNETINNRLARSSSGKISWMAMMVPEAATSNLYRAYMVVFKNRQLIFRRNEINGTDQIVGERIYTATPLTNGAGGGDFNLTYSSGVFEDNKNIRQGDWLLLTDNVSNFRWYRIVRINIDENDPDNPQVTLTGPDWDTTAVPNPTAIALSGVISVYEKTIPIENDSIWNQ